MALKVLLDNLDGVDDAVKTFYAEKDGKFVLDVEGIDDHPDVSNLKNAYSRTKEDREKAKTEAATLKAKITELEKGAPDTAATQAKLTALQEQLQAAEAKAGDWQTKYIGKARDEALTQALQAAGVTNPAFLKAARASIERDFKIELSDDGTPTVDPGMGPKFLPDFVKAWAAGPDGKDFVTPPQGGGAKGSDRPISGASLKRADFDKMDPAAQAKAVTVDKVQIVD